MQQRLGGDAADVEAGAAMGGALLDDGDLHAKLRGANGAHIAARAGADDDQIVGGTHGGCLWKSGAKDRGSRRAGFSKRVLDVHQEGHGLLAVDDAVVVGQREIHHRPRHDLAVADHGALLDAVHAENAGLRRVEDRRGQHASRKRRHWRW